MRGRGIVGAGKGTTLVISNGDKDNINRIIKSLEYVGVLIDGVSETVKHEVKTQEGGFLGMLLGTLGCFNVKKYVDRTLCHRNRKRV